MDYKPMNCPTCGYSILGSLGGHACPDAWIVTDEANDFDIECALEVYADTAEEAVELYREGEDCDVPNEIVVAVRRITDPHDAWRFFEVRREYSPSYYSNACDPPEKFAAMAGGSAAVAIDCEVCGGFGQIRVTDLPVSPVMAPCPQCLPYAAAMWACENIPHGRLANALTKEPTP